MSEFGKRSRLAGVEGQHDVAEERLKRPASGQMDANATTGLARPIAFLRILGGQHLPDGAITSRQVFGPTFTSFTTMIHSATAFSIGPVLA